MFARLITLLGILAVAGLASAAYSSTIVTDGSTVRTVHEVDNSQSHGTYEAFQSSVVTGCLGPSFSASDTYFSAIVYPECAPIGIVAPALPVVKIFSAATQKLGPCPYEQNHCITGYISIRIHGYWQGSLVLTTTSSAGEPSQTLTVPVPAGNYENLIVRLAGAYTQSYVATLRILGSLSEVIKETSRTVQVVAQPAGQNYWVASAEYASYNGENITVIVSHISPRATFCVRASFENGYTYERSPPPAVDFFGGVLSTVAKPSELRFGSNCAMPEVLMTAFVRLQETPTGGGGGNAGGGDSTRWERLSLQ